MYEVCLKCVVVLQVEAEGEVLGLFCGKEETDTEAVPARQVITSPRNSLSVEFTSDFSDEERYSGFMAHHSAVGEETSVVTGRDPAPRKDRVLSAGRTCRPDA